MKYWFSYVLIAFSVIACAQKDTSSNVEEQNLYTGEKVEKTVAEWSAVLSPEVFHVMREEGTERAFTSDLLNIKEEGTFVCNACGLPLFASETKFKSGTGWPSFYAPIDSTYVGEISDTSYGWSRVEVVCNRCDSHLGHVFEDGPKPTGLRYCINGVCLKFEPAKKP